MRWGSGKSLLTGAALPQENKPYKAQERDGKDGEDSGIKRRKRKWITS